MFGEYFRVSDSDSNLERARMHKKLQFWTLSEPQWARCCHEVASNVGLDIAKQFVIASNVFTSNGMAVFWQWLIDIAKSYNQLPQSCLIGHCWQQSGNVDASLQFSCHEAAGIGHCWQLCGNMDLSLPFSCYKVAGIGHLWQLFGNVDT